MSSNTIRFSKTHEWARRDGDQIVVGVTNYAVDQLNREIVFVELPEVGKNVKQGETFGVIEAVKTASDLYAPMSGEIIESNMLVSDNPNLVAEDPEGAGWLIKIGPSDWSEWEQLLDSEEYQTYIQSEEHH
jgi:glycine cleavage system H protein